MYIDGLRASHKPYILWPFCYVYFKFLYLTYFFFSFFSLFVSDLTNRAQATAGEFHSFMRVDDTKKKHIYMIHDMTI